LTVSCDSNVLIYAFSKQDKVYPEARLIVQGLVRLGTILCDQTIREFLAVAHRRRIISPENARSIATTFIDQFELSRAEAEDLLEGTGCNIMTRFCAAPPAVVVVPSCCHATCRTAFLSAQ
jgi:predicted nucleic acid-binding protein